MPKSGLPGDLFLLKSLCEKYKLRGIFEEVESRQRSEEEEYCEAGDCSNDCTYICAECYTCTADCVLSY